MSRRWILPFLVLALLAIGARPAQAADNTATIRGQVVSLDNVPLSGITVAAYDQPNTAPNRTPLAQTTTGADGRFSLTVPPGTFWVGMLTAERWGYDYTPISVKAGDVVENVVFVPAVRVLPAGAPTATAAPAAPAATAVPAAPATPVPGTVPPGMPTTGAPSPAPNVPLILVVFGAILVGCGGLALRRGSRVRV
jgi:Carboxypeptidase regulatory-like domain